MGKDRFVRRIAIYSRTIFIKFTVKHVLCQLYGNASRNLISEMFVSSRYVEKIEEMLVKSNINGKVDMQKYRLKFIY